VESYKVAIPLFANQQVVVDFQPTLASGHFYFPAYKDARVLIAIDLERAWLSRYLDWRPEARLPKETQGNHLLVGKTPRNGTSLRHVYEEDKPVLRLTRVPMTIDTQVIEIGEGHSDDSRCRRQKQPHSTLISTIRLDKNAGGSVVIRNDEEQYYAEHPPKWHLAGSGCRGLTSQEHHHPDPERGDDSVQYLPA
jgi:hypothetical protein